MKTTRINQILRVLSCTLAASLVVGSGRTVWAASDPDFWLTTRAKVAIAAARDLHAGDVHVDTFSGQMTLYGKVSDLTQRLHAGAIAARVAGERRVRNLLQIVPADRARQVEELDTQINRKVTDQLEIEPRLASGKVSVKSVDKGVVLLSPGATPSADLPLALDMTSRVAGVRRVVIEGQGPGARSSWTVAGVDERNPLKDEAITVSVELRLLLDPEVPALGIQVTTDGGLVTLTGVVPSPAVRAAAEIDALGVESVIDVENDLLVVPPNAVPIINSRA